MLQVFIIIFRETLEISLILGLILVATKELKNRFLCIMSGLAIGVIGSLLIAIFTTNISEAFDGLGQEYFNAVLILIITILLVWTVVWMNLHGKEISKKIKSVSQKINEGEASYITLTTIIASTIFREGSEMVLFTYGSYTANSLTLSMIASGSFVGLLVGGIVGYGIYKGITVFSGRNIFKITSVLLSLVAAGMAAQAVNFLNAAGIATTFSRSLWNSSAIIADGSPIGVVLNAVIGYNAQPTAMQLIAYFGTLIIIGLLTRLRYKTQS